MKNESLEPADKYIVNSKGIITEDKIKILTSLYQPIIGSCAISLYLTLLNDLNNYSYHEFNHDHLMILMQYKLDIIKEARYKLEGIGLLKTFIKRGDIDNYIYTLYSPISAYEFFNHPILNVVLYNNIGKYEYDRLIEYYKIPKINTREYEDITLDFESVFTVGLNKTLLFENKDIISDSKRNIVVKSNIDIDLLISSIPKRLVSDKCFSDDIKNLIYQLAYIYKIDNLNMQGIVRNSLNERGMINQTELKESCRNYYKFEHNGKLPTLIYNTQPEYLKTPLENDSKLAKIIYMFENISPYEFLKKSEGNVEPTARDKKLIETLMVEQKLNPGVINVLLDYVLRINNKKLNKDYIEAIVGQWKRLKVETVTDAMEVCKKEHKKIRKQINNNQNVSKNNIVNNTSDLPLWFDKEQVKDDSKINELNDVLKEFDII